MGDLYKLLITYIKRLVNVLCSISCAWGLETLFGGFRTLVLLELGVDIVLLFQGKFGL